MPYINGRPVTLGDWFIGPSHNSENKLAIGVVVQMMPKQGPCNVRLITFPSWGFGVRDSQDESDCITTYSGDGKTLKVEYREDYADAKELVHVMDGFRMVTAVH